MLNNILENSFMAYNNTKVQNEVNSEDKVPTNSEKKLSLMIGIFFDGTKNNRYNIDYYKSLDDDKERRKLKNSYRGEKTNIAKLFELYNPGDNMFCIYIEGIGTAEPAISENTLVSSKKDDSLFSQAFGSGDFGINRKIERACDCIIKEILLNDIKTVTTIELTLDVLGFSRGAAAARSFVSRIDSALGNTENKRVSLKQALSEHPRISKKEILIKKRFLGVFDTVSSFGTGWKSYNFNNDVGELQLTVPSDVIKTVHLVAADEYRLNFGLTTIDSAGNKEEIILPGEHSDIGGGHPEIEEVKFANNVGVISIDELVKEKWIKKENIETYRLRGKVVSIATKWTDNSYSNIALKLMGDKFVEAAKPVSFKGEYTNACKVNDTLTKLRDNILVNNNSYSISGGEILVNDENGTNFETIKEIRADHLHISAKIDIVNMPRVIVGSPKILGGKGVVRQKRKIYNG